jgi:hypothetical protein
MAGKCPDVLDKLVVRLVFQVIDVQPRTKMLIMLLSSLENQDVIGLVLKDLRMETVK